MIGCGRRGGELATAMDRRSDCFLVRCIDEDLDAAERLAGHRDGTDADDDIQAVLARSDIEAVVIATRPDSHAELVSEAARAGKHIFVEPPLATKFPDAARAHATVLAARVVACVDYEFRAAPGVQLVRSTLPRPSALVVHATVESLGGVWEGEAQHGGVLGTFGTHALDLAVYLASSRPVRVFGIGGRYVRRAGLPDTLAATIKFAGGAVAEVVVGEFGASGLRGTYWGSVNDASRRAELVCDMTAAQVFEGDRKIAATQEPTTCTTRCEEMLDSFFTAVRTGGRPRADTLDGARAVQVADGLYEAIGIQRSIEFQHIV